MALVVGLVAGPAHADPGVAIPDGFRMDDYRAPVPDTVPGAIVLDTAALQALIAANGAILIDVLPAPRRPDSMRPGIPWLPARHESLPGSLWWPEVGRGALPPTTMARLQQRLIEVTAEHAGRIVVFFCLPDCWMSWNAARRAAAMGFRAGWYPDGIDGWRVAGLPLASIQPEVLE